VDKRLEELERQQNQVLKEKERFSHLIEDAHRLQKEAQETKEKVLEEKESLDNEYRDQLNEYLENKKEEAKEIIKQMRDSQSGKVHTQIETMHDLDGLYVPANEKEATETFEVGDYVQIKNLNTHGEIVDIRKKEATIDAHGKKVRVKLNQLTHIHRPQIKTVSNKVKLNSPSRLPMELNIIGYRVDEGLNALNHYIDQAVAHKMSQVRIIHGVGSGVLRRAVWKDLDKHPMVKSKMAAGEGDGGLGATIVTLK
jgi:DNA mismatch repair protein MutS2